MLNCSRAVNKVVHLVSYNLLHSYKWFFSKGGLTRRGFLRAHNNIMLDQFGAPETDLIIWTVFNEAVNTYDNKIITIDEKQSTNCPDCGHRPQNLCFDGVCVRIMGG